MHGSRHRLLLSGTGSDCKEEEHHFNALYLIISIFLVIISGICSGLTLGKCFTRGLKLRARHYVTFPYLACRSSFVGRCGKESDNEGFESNWVSA